MQGINVFDDIDILAKINKPKQAEANPRLGEVFIGEVTFQDSAVVKSAPCSDNWMYLVLLGALNQTLITICTAEESCWCLVTSFVTKYTV